MSDTPAVSPHNLEAEKCVLGAILVRNELLCDAARVLEPMDFYRNVHERIFRGMLKLAEANSAIDLVTLTYAFRQTGELDDIGGPVYIASLADGVPRSANLEHYAAIVKQTARARDFLASARQAIDEVSANPGALSNGAGTRFADAVRSIVEDAHRRPKRVALALTMTQLEGFEFAPRRPILMRAGQAILREGHIAQISAIRGTGKTRMARTIAMLAATGTDAMGFSAPESCRALIIDGEMASEELQAMDAELRQSLNVLPTDNLVTIAADWQEDALPRLDTPAGQAFVEPFVEAAQFIVIDNRSTLCDSESEKDPSAWQPMQDWLLSLRRRGKAVLIVHHANRQGTARGHSKPEDVMNTVISLTRPEDYRADQGARFLVEFPKSRGFYGAAAMPFTTQLTGGGWVVEGEDQPAAERDASAAHRSLRQYLQIAHKAGDRPKSANAGIRGASVKRVNGLKAWADMLHRGEIVKHQDGGFYLNE